MPRPLRIEQPGYYHIINRGVARMNVFLKEGDFQKFLEIIATVKERYDFVLHSFCLMNNHYHLLLETKHENLSLIMRQINNISIKLIIGWDRFGRGGLKTGMFIKRVIYIYY